MHDVQGVQVGDGRHNLRRVQSRLRLVKDARLQPHTRPNPCELASPPLSRGTETVDSRCCATQCEASAGASQEPWGPSSEHTLQHAERLTIRQAWPLPSAHPVEVEEKMTTIHEVQHQVQLGCRL